MSSIESDTANETFGSPMSLCCNESIHNNQRKKIEAINAESQAAVAGANQICHGLALSFNGCIKYWCVVEKVCIL